MINGRVKRVNVQRLLGQGMLWDRMMEITDTIAEDLTANKKLIETKICGMNDELRASFYSNSGNARRYHADEDPILVIFKDPKDGSLWMNYLFPNA